MLYRIIILFFFLISIDAHAHIGSKSFAHDYFGRNQPEKDYLTLYVSTINSIPNDTAICILDCDFAFISNALGFHRTNDILYFGSLVTIQKASISLLPASLKNEYEEVFYNAIVTAMITARTNQDTTVFIEELGGFTLLPDDSFVFSSDLTLDPDYSKTAKDKAKDVPTYIPGIAILERWTWTGTGYVRLAWHTGTVCYISTGCYQYDFSLSFKQVGESSYGVPIYCQLGKPSGTIFLKGDFRGGIKVWVDSSVIGQYNGTNIESAYSFLHSPSYWY